ncbi:hypothetical protein QJS10_CPA08g01915 [Acorus calamus]|uniref:Uncharacterized protein n=1 Tax=Acorus calamus TaxID=4465 RepID=A0AAV9EEP9_ACOCL|nr:hypothetical protein QJS10_CPA08g01915 [Acorus calamus]
MGGILVFVLEWIMSQYQEDEADYMADDYEMADMEDDLNEEFHGREMGDSDSEEDEYGHAHSKITDTSATQARKGKDIQGIPWDRLTISREKYRQTRLEQYKNYENVPQSGEGSEKECKPTRKGGMFYEFQRNSRSVKSTFVHFQDGIHVPCTRLGWESQDIPSIEKHPGSLLEGFTQTQISTLSVRDNLLVAGGFQGELICKYLDRPGISFCTRTTYDENAITNAVEIYDSSSGTIHFMASNNDCGVRDFDMEKSACQAFSLPCQLMAHTSLSPDRKLVVIVGDNADGLLVDPNTGKTVEDLRGHLDYSFASAWHPDGRTFATGNQDKTCRVWDVRNLSKSLAVLKGNLGAIRSIRYTSDGQFMAMVEPADFVHIFDVRGGYEKQQEIDFFGEISGVSFSPDTESLFIGVWDRTYGSLLQYGRSRNYSYLDSIL